MICVKNEMPSASGTSVVVSGTLCSTLNEAEEYSADFANRAKFKGGKNNGKIQRRTASSSSAAGTAAPSSSSSSSNNRPRDLTSNKVASSLDYTTNKSSMCQNLADSAQESPSSSSSFSADSAVLSSATAGRRSLSTKSAFEIQQQDRKQKVKLVSRDVSFCSSSVGGNDVQDDDDDNDGESKLDYVSSQTSSSGSLPFQQQQLGSTGCSVVPESFRQPRSPSVGDSSSSSIVDSVASSEELKESVISCDPIGDDDEEFDEEYEDDSNMECDSSVGGSSARTLGFSLEELKKWKIRNECSVSSSSGRDSSSRIIKVDEEDEEEEESDESMLMTGSRSNGEAVAFAQLDEPKIILFDREKVQPGWKNKMPIGCGFVNLGNSCYLNATLQALFHTPAFINWLLDDEEHRSRCQKNSQSLHQCVICPMANTAFEAYSRNNQSIRPILIHEKLKIIGRTLTSGRQEDAHEFMRLLLESMENSYLTAVNGHKLDSRSKETTPLGQIFGGYYRDEVTCLKCNFVSTTFHPQAELQLDIRNVGSIEDGIALHFKRESLENNDYRCEKCGTIEPATKQHFLEMAPIVLCVQLKRFRQHGTKITKPIHINRTLNLKQYIHPQSPDSESDASYRLVGLISHIGTSPNCGHYTAIAEAQNGMFYHFDDSCVRMTNLTCNQNSDAYVVIYEMKQNPVLPLVARDVKQEVCSSEASNSAASKEIEASAACSSSGSDKPLNKETQNDIKSSRPLPQLPPIFSARDGGKPWGGVLPTPLYDMTVDEIIDKWCTPSRSTNFSEFNNSIQKGLFTKDAAATTVGTDMNRNQIFSHDRKRHLPQVPEELDNNDDSNEAKEKKSRRCNKEPLVKEGSSAVTAAAAGAKGADGDGESEDLIK